MNSAREELKWALDEGMLTEVQAYRALAPMREDGTAERWGHRSWRESLATVNSWSNDEALIAELSARLGVEMVDR